MAEVTVKQLDEFDTAYGGAMKRVRAGLGVTSFGMQVFDIPPNFDNWPEHDHADDGQEEVYTVLDGAVKLHAGGESHELIPGVFARVAPSVARTLSTGDQPARVLALGATPGAPYQVQEWTEEGAEVPTATAAT
jgi:quercetin dioxygenase-like cupin family protein